MAYELELEGCARCHGLGAHRAMSKITGPRINTPLTDVSFRP
jgi:hypothetical protein